MGATRRIGSAWAILGIVLTAIGIVDLLAPADIHCTLDHDLQLCVQTAASRLAWLGLFGPMLAMIGGLLAIGPVEATDPVRSAGWRSGSAPGEPAVRLRTGRR